MSIAITSRDAVAVAAGAGGFARKRVNSGTAQTAPATALLLSGPANGDVGEASLVFTVSANGSLGGTVDVALAVTGITGSLSASSVQLTPGVPIATFTFTATSEGAASITATATGMTAAVATYEASIPRVAIPNWVVWLNPEQAWEAPHSTIPAEASFGSGGEENKIRLSLEADAYDDTIYSVDVDEVDVWDGSAPSGITLTPTTVQRGFVTPTYETIRRVADPEDAGKKVFEIRLNKTEVNHAADPLAKCRGEVTPTGVQRSTPFLQEVWTIGALYLPESLLMEEHPLTGGYYTILLQLHDDNNGLCGNPPIAIDLEGGNGDASAARLVYNIKQYNGAGWPDAPVKGSVRMVDDTTLVAAPTPDTWHYIIVHHKSNCDFADPVLGNIYGPTGPGNSVGFVRIYHAEGNGSPVQLVDYHGYWNAPYVPGAKFAKAEDLVGGLCKTYGYWKTGIYTRNSFTPAAAGDTRTVMNKGVKEWRVIDNPGIDVWSVLEDFRG